MQETVQYMYLQVDQNKGQYTQSLTCFNIT